MRATVIELDRTNPLKRRVWEFYFIDWYRGIVLEGYREESKQTGRHKWRPDQIYDRLMKQRTTITPASIAPEIEAQARDIYRRMISDLPIRL